jgi:hypothetical protein
MRGGGGGNGQRQPSSGGSSVDPRWAPTVSVARGGEGGMSTVGIERRWPIKGDH